VKLTDFYTRDKANEGRTVDVPGPDGKPCGVKFTIHSSDCDAFRRGKAAILAKGLDIASLPDDKRADAVERLNLEMVALCVSGWEGMEDDFSQDALVTLFQNAPYLAAFVERIADNRTLFFGKGSGSSSSSQKETPGSKNTRKTVKSGSATS
jgi:hypothetical protein